jgi:hypothetical protein
MKKLIVFLYNNDIKNTLIPMVDKLKMGMLS